MSESKKYYWLKLKSDFFDDDTIKFIEEQENGIKYSNFYLKLCLKSLKTDGKLIRLVGETLIPYDINSLSKLTGVEFDTVRSAMQLFESIGLIKVLESGEIYLSQIDELIGSETDKAQIMRRLRAERKLEGNNVTQMLPEIEIEKEIDKEIDNNIYKKPQTEKPEVENPSVENQGQLNTNKQNTKKLNTNNIKEKINKKKYGDFGNVLLTDDEHIKLQQLFPNDYIKRIQILDDYIQSKGKKYKDFVATLKNWARRDGYKFPEEQKEYKELTITEEEYHKRGKKYE